MYENLTETDVQILLDMGYDHEDMQQIDEATYEGEYRDYQNRRISMNKAIEKLGIVTWLSGIARAAFHCSCSRGEGENYVVFDLGKWWK